MVLIRRDIPGNGSPAFAAFLESTDFENALRLAVSLGGDTDTLACITGSISEAFYGGVPGWIAEKVMALLDNDLRRVTEEFVAEYPKLVSPMREETATSVPRHDY